MKLACDDSNGWKRCFSFSLRRTRNWKLPTWEAASERIELFVNGSVHIFEKEKMKRIPPSTRQFRANILGTLYEFFSFSQRRYYYNHLSWARKWYLSFYIPSIHATSSPMKMYSTKYGIPFGRPLSLGLVDIVLISFWIILLFCAIYTCSSSATRHHSLLTFFGMKIRWSCERIYKFNRMPFLRHIECTSGIQLKQTRTALFIKYIKVRGVRVSLSLIFSLHLFSRARHCMATIQSQEARVNPIKKKKAFTEPHV